MNAVAKQQPTAVAEVVEVATPSSILDVIARVASDPTVDIDKLDRLLAMHERVTERQAKQAYAIAMNDAQAEMRPVSKDAANPQTKSRYASYGALDSALRPIYTAHGFSLSFYQGEGAPADCVRVACKVAHRDGHEEHPHIDMPADGKGAKGGDVMTKTHATGSAFTYGQRYLLTMIFNIAKADDDGNAAGGQPKQAPSQKGQHANTTVVAMAKAAIDMCLTYEDTRAWWPANQAALNAMTDPEFDEVRNHYDAHQKLTAGGPIKPGQKTATAEEIFA